MSFDVQFIDRIMPSVIHLERSVLGACMLGGHQAVDRARSILPPEAFYHTANRKLYSAICSLSGRSEPVDQASVVEELTKHGVLEDVGGHAYVIEIAGDVATDGYIEHHGKLVLEAYVRRSLILRSGQLIDMCYDQGEELPDIASAAYSLTEDLETAEHEAWSQGDVLLEEVFADAEYAWEHPDEVRGVSTGLHDFDAKTNGLEGGDLVLFAGRPSMGKTALALHIARVAAGSVPVGIVSVEMKKKALMMRLLASEARVDLLELRSGTLDPEARRRVSEAAGTLKPVMANIHIGDRVRRPSQIAVESRKLKRKYGVGLLVVDYLQLLTPDTGKKNDSREREVASIGQALKNLAVDLDVPVLAVVQLSRAVEQRPDCRPRLSDLRESGSLEQDADLVAFLYRMSYYGLEDKDGRDVTNLCEIIIGKQRNGPVGHVNCYFDKTTGFFGDWTETAGAQEEEVPRWVDE